MVVVMDQVWGFYYGCDIVFLVGFGSFDGCWKFGKVDFVFGGCVYVIGCCIVMIG